MNTNILDLSFVSMMRLRVSTQQEPLSHVTRPSAFNGRG